MSSRRQIIIPLGGRYTQVHCICIYASSNWIITDSGNGVSPVERQDIARYIACASSIGPFRINYNEISIEFFFFQLREIFENVVWTLLCILSRPPYAQTWCRSSHLVGHFRFGNRHNPFQSNSISIGNDLLDCRGINSINIRSFLEGVMKAA